MTVDSATQSLNSKDLRSTATESVTETKSLLFVSCACSFTALYNRHAHTTAWRQIPYNYLPLTRHSSVAESVLNPNSGHKTANKQTLLLDWLLNLSPYGTGLTYSKGNLL